MQLLAFILIAFVVTGHTSTLPSQLNVFNTKKQKIPSRDQTNCLPCICGSRVNSGFNHAGILQSKRSHPGEVSMSPSEPSISLQQSPSPANSSQAHVFDQQKSQLWPPTVETVLTALFRAVVTVLSLLNVNFTWRIHGSYMTRLFH